LTEGSSVFCSAVVVSDVSVKFHVEFAGTSYDITHTTNIPKSTTFDKLCGFFYVGNLSSADPLVIEVNNYTYEKYSTGLF
jgi:hypothetical protein